jgi:AraC-like DNA-binding protein
MKLDALHIVSIIAIFQSLFMAFFYLLHRNKYGYANRILSAMMFCFSLLIGFTLFLSIDEHNVLVKYHKPFFILSQVSFLIGPLLLFYIRSLLNPNWKISKRDAVHIIPFIIAVACSFVIISNNKSFIIWIYPGRLYLALSISVQMLLYFFLSVRALHACGLTVRLFFSFLNDPRVHWIRFFLIGYVVLWLIQFNLFIGWDVLRSPGWCPYTFSLYFLASFIFFNGIVYLHLKKPDLFIQQKKYRYSILKESDKEAYRDKVYSAIVHKRLYLQPTLTLIGLSREISIAPCHLSQIINESYRTNFCDFINGFRVEESKRLLSQFSGKRNIIDIAFESGFNSKSAFNHAFKKFTGLTPKVFQQELAEK